ncbi:ABC transporter permease [Paludibaculum fermentans]|uniref:ABC transporter permease n=1 Tax=Paludibaculum fermentans TaxID=1473598 RepID=A0A7S7NNI3_PALFE|nr:ABC transporter permease subunit [Paludibaculum fermentans]QOY86824.1 ABC transporter permease [Paludibaculum fermentans]
MTPDLLYALVNDTLREARGRKLVVALFAQSALSVAALAWMAHGSAGLSLQPPAALALLREGLLRSVLFLYFWQLFAAALLTTPLLGSCLQRGRIEYLLARPVARWRLLLGRLIGCLCVLALNFVLVFGGSSLVLGLGSGIWIPSLLWAVPATLLAAGVLLSASLLVVITVRSTALAGFAACALLAASLLASPEPLLRASLSPAATAILPRFYGMCLGLRDLMHGSPSWHWQEFAVSAAMAILCTTAALLIFEKQDC